MKSSADSVRLATACGAGLPSEGGTRKIESVLLLRTLDLL